MKKVILFLAIVVFLAACNNTDKTTGIQENTISDSSIMLVKEKDSLSIYTAEMLDSKKDHVCGMPVSAGISDTAHFNAKVYGFCSKECKDEFVKEPDKYLSVK